MNTTAIPKPFLLFLSSILFIVALDVQEIAAAQLSNIETNALRFNEGSGPQNVTNTIDVESNFARFIFSATITLKGYNPDEDVLSCDGTSLTVSWDKEKGILLLTGLASASRYETALRNVRYHNTNRYNPSTDSRAVSFMVYDGNNSNIVSREIIVVPSNGRPTLSNIETAPLNYCQNSGDVWVTSSLNIADDNPDMVFATVTIASGYVQNTDALTFVSQNGINGNWNASTGTLRLEGVSPVAFYQEALRSVGFRTFSASGHSRTIIFSVNDGEIESNLLSRNVTVFAPLTARFTGGGFVCAEEVRNVSLTVTFGGTAPWTFTLSRDGFPIENFGNIHSNPFTFNVSSAGTYKIDSFWDAVCKGDTTGSGKVVVAARPVPTAVISGIDTICQGGMAELRIAFAGEAPWKVTVNLNDTVYANIFSESPEYVLRVDKPGIYTLSELSDVNCKGNVSGTGIVRLHQRPTAALSGSPTVCDGSPAGISVALTGTQPWNYSYRLNSEDPVERRGVTSSPDNFNVWKEGTYSLTAVSDKFCSGIVSGSAIVTVLPLPVVNINPIKEVYSRVSEEWVELTAVPQGGSFSGPGVIPYNNKWYFITNLPPVGTHNIVYRYRESAESCYGYDTITVRIIEKSAEIQIESNRTRFCKNDAPFLIKGINLINDSLGTFSISGGAGLVDHYNNTATVYPAQLNVNQYTIIYTPKGETPVDKVIEIGNALSANFTWNMECFESGGEVLFTNSTQSPFGYISDTSFTWALQTDSGTVYANTRNAAYQYTAPGIYRIMLTAKNSYGCMDSVGKDFHLRPVIALAGTNFFEDFESSSHWIAESNTGINSWRLGNPEASANYFSGAASGEKCWYTHIPGIAAPAEESRITGPCFDFRGTEKPTMVSQIWRAFLDSKDGANIQYTLDNGLTWIPIGNINGGINWFNGYYGLPGFEKKGWTNVRDSRWMEARYSLDFLKDKPRVQFRFTYSATGNALGNDGIALDDFQIVERNRIILIEHFTNTSHTDCALADSMLDAITDAHASNVINLQYHTSYPPNDPFNEENPIVPTTRQFYYNLADVPYAVINGGREIAQRIDFQSTHLNEDQIVVQSLYDSDFSLALTSMLKNGILYIEPALEALTDIPLTEITLRLAVILPEVHGITGQNGDTVFRNVVIDMVPGPAGTTIYKDWFKGETASFGQIYEIRSGFEQDSLRVIAFIQNESSREIYQAAIDTRGLLSSSEEPRVKEDREILVYPNPADEFVYIAFKDSYKGMISLTVYSITGKVVYTNRFDHATGNGKIDTRHLPGGMYMIKIISQDGSEYIGKFIVSR